MKGLRMTLSLERTEDAQPVTDGTIAVTVIHGDENTDWTESLADASKFALAMLRPQVRLATGELVDLGTVTRTVNATDGVPPPGGRAMEGAPDGSEPSP